MKKMTNRWGGGYNSTITPQNSRERRSNLQDNSNFEQNVDFSKNVKISEKTGHIEHPDFCNSNLIEQINNTQDFKSTQEKNLPENNTKTTSTQRNNAQIKSTQINKTQENNLQQENRQEKSTQENKLQINKKEIKNEENAHITYNECTRQNKCAKVIGDNMQKNRNKDINTLNIENTNKYKNSTKCNNNEQNICITKTRKFNATTMILLWLLSIVFCCSLHLLNISSNTNKTVLAESVAVATSFAGGDGETEATAYEISNFSELLLLKKGSNGKFFKITNDIIIPEKFTPSDTNTETFWTGISDFRANLDGQGHTITLTNAKQGLFNEVWASPGYSLVGSGVIPIATSFYIKNINIKGTINNTNDKFLGGLIGSLAFYDVSEYHGHLSGRAHV